MIRDERAQLVPKQ